MNDENYWKDRYKDFWDEAAKKEENVKKFIEKKCDCECEYVGLGAGTTQYLSGSAKSQGFKKGGSDLHVKGTNISIEVTGPNTDGVGEDAALWIRPDKVQNAIADSKNDHWVVHVLKKNVHMRTIHMNKDFKKAYTEFEIITPTIRYSEEKYVEIPADSEFVDEIDTLINTIKKALAK
jgi:hypothetical protein